MILPLFLMYVKIWLSVFSVAITSFIQAQEWRESIPFYPDSIFYPEHRRSLRLDNGIADSIMPPLPFPIEGLEQQPTEVLMAEGMAGKRAFKESDFKVILSQVYDTRGDVALIKQFNKKHEDYFRYRYTRWGDTLLIHRTSALSTYNYAWYFVEDKLEVALRLVNERIKAGIQYNYLDSGLAEVKRAYFKGIPHQNLLRLPKLNFSLKEPKPFTNFQLIEEKSRDTMVVSRFVFNEYNAQVASAWYKYRENNQVAILVLACRGRGRKCMNTVNELMKRSDFPEISDQRLERWNEVARIHYSDRERVGDSLEVIRHYRDNYNWTYTDSVVYNMQGLPVKKSRWQYGKLVGIEELQYNSSGNIEKVEGYGYTFRKGMEHYFSASFVYSDNRLAEMIIDDYRNGRTRLYKLYHK